MVAKCIVLYLTAFCDCHHTLRHLIAAIITSSAVELRSHRCSELGAQVAKGRISIVVERCKACGFCVEFCPTHVLALSSAFNSKGYHPPHVVHPEKCSGCDLCGMYCPDFAIYGTKVPEPKRTESVTEAKTAGGEK